MQSPPRQPMAAALGLVLLLLSRSAADNAVQHATRSFLAALSAEQRATVQFDFSSDVRTRWSYLPGARPGLKLRAMNAEQKRAAHVLLRSLLATPGYLKVTSIMALEPVLAALERAAGGDGASRDSEQYSFAIFGDPAGSAPWGWRMEGHHIVLSYTSVGTLGTAVTPFFLGTHPAEVAEGSSAGLRVLAAEEDLALALMNLLDEAERKLATIPGAVPGDVMAGPARTAASIDGLGIALSELESEELSLVHALVRAFTDNHHGGESAAARVAQGELKDMRFAWWGAIAAREAHAWRLVTPTTVLEFDNREAGSGHVHVVWRDKQRDHAADLLEQHLKEHHGAGK